MTPEQAAAVARTEREIAEAFTSYGLAEPDEKAAALVKHLQRRGWRVFLTLVDRPGPRGGRGPSEYGRQRMAEARAAVLAKRGSRPERLAQDEVLGKLCRDERHPEPTVTVTCLQPAGHDGDHRSVDGRDVW